MDLRAAFSDAAAAPVKSFRFIGSFAVVWNAWLVPMFWSKILFARAFVGWTVLFICRQLCFKADICKKKTAIFFWKNHCRIQRQTMMFFRHLQYSGAPFPCLFKTSQTPDWFFATPSYWTITFHSGNILFLWKTSCAATKRMNCTRRSLMMIFSTVSIGPPKPFSFFSSVFAMKKRICTGSLDLKLLDHFSGQKITRLCRE